VPKLKLTKKNVDALAPAERPYVAYDTELTGFGVRVMPTGSKSWVIEYRPGAGGRGVRSTLLSLGRTTLLTPDEARRLAKDKLADARRGEDPAAKRAADRGTLTLSRVIELYLADVEAKKSRGTHALYKIYLEVHVAPELGSRKVNAITRADVAKLHRRLGQDRKPTANRVLNTLSGVFTFAARAGLVEDGFNPTKGVEKFREEGRERFLSTEEIHRLGAALAEAETVGLPWEPDTEKATAKHAPKPENRRVVLPPQVTGAVRLLLFTGCRLREILHLRWREVDFERGLLFLPTSKTGKKTIVLNAPALQVLNSLPRLGEFVIAGNDPSRPRADLKKPWAALTQRAGLEGLRIHDLRHSFASVGAGSGMGLPLLGKLLGHSQPSTTQRYAHLDADPLRHASERIAAALVGALEGDLSAEVVPLRKPAS